MRETRPVRAGEEIDTGSLHAFLSAQLGETGEEIEVEQFPAGSSNLTYLVRIGSDEYVLRRPPFGNTVKSAHDMSREYKVLSKLSQHFSPAPKPLLYCSDEQVIGSEFYLMERRHGLIIRSRIPETADPAHSIDTSQDLRLDICRSFIETLSDLHALNISDVGLEELGKPEGYNVRQVEGWTKRYFTAKTDEHRELETAIEWLNANIPVETRASLIHNDYKFDNIMLDPADPRRVVGVIDWESVTLGDRLMDRGAAAL